MSDPAVEAAQRAWVKHHGDTWDGPAHLNPQRALTLSATREALAPLRSLHKPCAPYMNDNPYQPQTMIRDCDECDYRWPCDTAILIYPSEEL